MERLWAPWRIDYITGAKPTGCIFCLDGERRGNLVLYETSLLKVLLNRYPYNNGHLLVAPVRHLADPDLLTPGEMLGLFSAVALCRRVLLAASKPDGFNVGMNLGKMAGAGVEEHLHLHVVPRWGGDTNFIAAVADTRVLPEALFSTYDRLLPHFEAAGEG
jgi:ATP adenylyltransferase